MPFISFYCNFLPVLIKNYFLRSTIINSNIYCKKIQLFKTVIIYSTIISFFSCNSTTNNSSTKVIDKVELLRGYFRKNYPIKLDNRIDKINEYHFLLRNEKLRFNLIVPEQFNLKNRIIHHRIVDKYEGELSTYSLNTSITEFEIHNGEYNYYKAELSTCLNKLSELCKMDDNLSWTIYILERDKEILFTTGLIKIGNTYINSTISNDTANKSMLFTYKSFCMSTYQRLEIEIMTNEILNIYDKTKYLKYFQSLFVKYLPNNYLPYL